MANCGTDVHRYAITAVVGLVLSLAGCATSNIQNFGVSQSGSIGGYEAKFIDVNGARTRYYDVGSGEVILLVHGARPSGTSSANTWVHEENDLAAADVIV